MPSKRHAALWCALATTFGVKPKSRARVERAQAEFFYKSLPALGKDLDRGLSGRFVLTAPFKKQRNTSLPSFLYELFILVFDKDGYPRMENYRKIRELRQLLMMFYKFVVPFTDCEIGAGTTKFIETDRMVKTSAYPFGLAEVRSHFCSLLPDDPMDIRCHHSNGATADRYSNPEKREVRRFIPSLMQVYNLQYFFNSGHHVQSWCSVFPTITDEPPARLAFVPKDSRGPRIICMEPHERMFVQKGLQTLLYDHIERYSPAKGYINFSDQSVNQKLAHKASVDRSYATIDLKDASDLVPWALIKYLVPTHWLRALESTRSPRVKLPSGDVYPIAKFASMGSALCFPIEAMVFWSISRTVTSEVYVYGDDIIVPTNVATDVITALESYGLLVNRDKTLIEGHFRESCGGEFFDGYNIGYVKLKSYDYMEYVAFCNEITKQFGCSSSEPLLHLFEMDTRQIIFRAPISDIDYPSPGLYYTNGSLSSNDVFFRRRWNADIQRYQYRRLLPHQVSKHYRHSIDHDLLFDWLTSKASLTPRSDDFWSTISKCLPFEGDYKIRRKVLTYGQILPVRDPGEVSLRTKLKYTWV